MTVHLLTMPMGGLINEARTSAEGAVNAILILMYHGLWPPIDSPAELTRHWAADPQFHDPGARLYALDQRVFEAQMKAIAAAGCPPLAGWPSPAPTTASPPSPPGGGAPDVWITFDDGHCSNHAIAWPILAACGLRAMFFITTGWIGKHGFMDASQLRDLHAAGMLIGAHGASHRYFSDLAAGEIRREMIESKARLEDLLGAEVPAMSLPGGRNRATVRHLAREAGYRHLFTSTIGLARRDGDPYNWPRIPLNHRLPDDFLPRLLAGDTLAVQRMARNAAIRRWVQWMLGNRAYDYLRAQVLKRRLARPCSAAVPPPRGKS